jgi:predicted DNA-binding ribbon-helix-helix protein
MNKLKKHTVKMNLTMSQEFYDYLQELADKEYLRVSTFVKQLIMKSVLDGHHAKDNPAFNKIEEEINKENDFNSMIMGKKKK